MKHHIFLSFTCLLLNSIIYAQGRVDGFFPKKGQATLVIGGGIEVTEKFYAGNELVNLGRTTYITSIYSSYGILNDLEVSIAAPYIWINNERDWQDGSVYLKYKVLEISGKHRLSLSLTGGYSTFLTPYQTEGLSAIGQQATIYDIRPILHFTNSSQWFFTAQLGILQKENPTPDATNVIAKVGKAHSNFYFDLWYDYQTSDGGLDYRGTPAPSTFKELGVDYHKVGGTIFLPISKCLGSYFGGFYTLDGRNINKGLGVNLGIVLKSGK